VKVSKEVIEAHRRAEDELMRQAVEASLQEEQMKRE